MDRRGRFSSRSIRKEGLFSRGLLFSVPLSAAVFFDVGVLALDDDLHGLVAAEHVTHHSLLALKAFIDAEEVLDLAGDVVGQLGNVLIGVVGRVLEGNGNDLLVEVFGLVYCFE